MYDIEKSQRLVHNLSASSSLGDRSLAAPSLPCLRRTEQEELQALEEGECLLALDEGEDDLRRDLERYSQRELSEAHARQQVKKTRDAILQELDSLDQRLRALRVQPRQFEAKRAALQKEVDNLRPPTWNEIMDTQDKRTSDMIGALEMQIDKQK